MTKMAVSQFDPDVNAVLNHLLNETQNVLGGQFTGMYVHGSLACGDYDAARSDIDLLVVTRSILSAETVKGLQSMHERITTCGLARATNIEVSYIPLTALRRYHPADCDHLALRANGTSGIDKHGSEWVIQRFIVREKGVVLAGPDPRTLIDPIGPEYLRRAIRDLLIEWWLPQLSDPFRLRNDEYQAYAVLTMCRMLYTMEHGTVVSKPVAARWAQSELEPRWSDLIARAAAWHHGLEMRAYDESLAMIRYTVAHCCAP